jgi:hypothetical protein
MVKTSYPWQQIIKNEHVYHVISFLVLCAMYIGVQLNWYVAAGRDDVYITLWSAFGVSQGHGFVNYNFQPAEISSSLLHVLMLSLFALLSVDDIFVINKMIGIGCGLLTIGMLYYSSEIFFPQIKHHKQAALLVILLLIFSPVWMYWTAGGLENAIVCVILLWFVRSLLQSWAHEVVDWVSIGTSASLLILVRSEGFIYLSMIGLLGVLWWYVRGMPKSILWAILLPVVVFGVVSLWRWYSFGVFFPNPTYAKVHVPHSAWALIYQGIQYTRSFYTLVVFHAGIWPMLIGACCVAICAMATKKKYLFGIPGQYSFIAFIVLINHLFIIMVGGDWMELNRFVQPVIPLMGIVVVGGIYYALYWIRAHKFARDALIVTVGYSVVLISMGVFVWRGMNMFFRWTSWSEVHWSIYLVIACGCVVAGCASVLLRHKTQSWRYFGMVLLMVGVVVIPTEHRFMTKTRNICGNIVDMNQLFTTDISSIETYLHTQNCAQRRDYKFVAGFMTPQFQLFADTHDNYVGLLSRQAGFVPYYIKRTYPSIRFYFIDEIGLTDPYVATLIQKYGGAYQFSHEWADYITSNNINMRYFLADEPPLPAYVHGEWQTIYSASGANIQIQK